MEVMALLLFWIGGSMLVAALADNRGQSGILAFLLAFLGSPVVMLLVVLCRPNFKREEIEAKRHAELLEAARGGKQ